MTITEQQAQRLAVKSRTRWSPYLEKCCLLLSANESYQRAEEDIQVLTGIKVSHGTQQRMVHRQTFELLKVDNSVSEISIDGGKIRLRTPLGQACQWRDAARRAKPSPSFGLCPIRRGCGAVAARRLRSFASASS